MDPITQQQALATAGAAGGERLYVEDLFSIDVWEGNDTTTTITNGIDLSGEGGMVWIKRRNGSAAHHIYDSERGQAYLQSQTSSTETTLSSGSFTLNSDGFTINGTESSTNRGGSTYVAWTFRKAPKFFDIVTYTGDGTNGRTIPHGLESVPGLIIVKRRDTGSANWTVYQKDIGNGYYIELDTDLRRTSSSTWNNTTPTDTGFTVNDFTTVNASGNKYVAYLFADNEAAFGQNEDESIIRTGYFRGSSVVTLGWEPQYTLFKKYISTSNEDWKVIDNLRGMPADPDYSSTLFPNLTFNESDQSADGAPKVYPIATGFNAASGFSSTSNYYMYLAIRRPHKPPSAGTDVFHVQTPRAATDGTASQLVYTSNFPVDLSINIVTSGNTLNGLVTDRMRKNEFLLTNTTNAEATSIWEFDSNDGVYFNQSRTAASDQCGFLFRRVPGFFDMVAYEGTGVARTIDHSLTVAPELIIGKCRDTAATTWLTYASSLGATKYLELNDGDAETTASTVWNDTAPTSSVFSVGTSSGINASGATYIAYLFATLPGISKVGSYTGTGSDINVDCGFTAGARFVLIKRTDSTGDWYVWDTARGIIAGNDPYVLFNTTDAEVTSTDYIDPLNSGFTVTSTAPAGLNASGGTYLFLAIA